MRCPWDEEACESQGDSYVGVRRWLLRILSINADEHVHSASTDSCLQGTRTLGPKRPKNKDANICILCVFLFLFFLISEADE